MRLAFEAIGSSDTGLWFSTTLWPFFQTGVTRAIFQLSRKVAVCCILEKIWWRECDTADVALKKHPGIASIPELLETSRFFRMDWILSSEQSNEEMVVWCVDIYTWRIPVRRWGEYRWKILGEEVRFLGIISCYFAIAHSWRKLIRS